MHPASLEIIIGRTDQEQYNFIESYEVNEALKSLAILYLRFLSTFHLKEKKECSIYLKK